MYAWIIYYENADTDEKRTLLGTIEASTMAEALQKASEYFEYAAHDLVAVKWQ